MAGLIAGLRRPLGGNYNLWRLVDSRFFPEEPSPSSPQIICDIDKTYLETDFDTLLQIAKIAFEDAHDKITVVGASEVLLAARWGNMRDLSAAEDQRYPRPLHFVSSSPPQLRKVLEEKFTLDGLDWSSDTFKNQAYNLRKGRFDQLKQQIAYKTGAILNLINNQPPGSHYVMLGDNAEADSFIYLGVKLFIEKRLSAPKFIEYLQLMGVDPRVARLLLERFPRPPQGQVDAILIRRVKDVPFYDRSAITKPIVLFDNFIEVALIFALLGLLSGEDLREVLRTVYNRYALPREALAGVLRQAEGLVNQQLSRDQLAAILAQYVRDDSVEASAGKSLRLPEASELALLNEEEILESCKRWLEFTS